MHNGATPPLFCLFLHCLIGNVAVHVMFAVHVLLYINSESLCLGLTNLFSLNIFKQALGPSVLQTFSLDVKSYLFCKLSSNIEV